MSTASSCLIRSSAVNGFIVAASAIPPELLQFFHNFSGDVALTILLYILLRPVQANLALLTVFSRLMATATFAFAELFYFMPSLILGEDGYLKTFSPDQLNALALLLLNVYGTAGNFFVVFYGIASMLLGYLMVRLGYLPRLLGALWVPGGLGFVTINVLPVLTPAYASPFLLLPTVVANLSLGL